MDRQLLTIIEFQSDDFEQIRLTIWPEKQRPAWFVIPLLEGVVGERMVDGMEDVFIRDVVLAGCRVNVHTDLL